MALFYLLSSNHIVVGHVQAHTREEAEEGFRRVPAWHPGMYVQSFAAYNLAEEDESRRARDRQRELEMA